jgi:PAS domain-containing protein
MVQMISNKNITAQDLIYSTNFVKDSVSLREVRTWFTTQPNVRSLGVVKEDGQIGLMMRDLLTQVLLEHAGNPAILDQPISGFMIQNPLKVSASTPIHEIIERLLNERSNDESFFQDIIVCSEMEFIGLIVVKDVVVDQLGNIMHRLSAMEGQNSALARQNKELFENSFRQGQKETQFRSVFDYAPLPIVVFDKEGQFLAASLRFSHLAHYGYKQIDGNFQFTNLFANDFQAVISQAREMLNDASNPEQMFQSLNLLTFQQTATRVLTLVEITPDWGHVIISILRIQRDGEMLENHLSDIIKTTSLHPMGRITQAIKMKVQHKDAAGLARSVANNLIDREEEVDRLMTKLEKIIEFSSKVEQYKETPPSSSIEIEKDERHHMRGTLSEFSVIDLCQILIQGTKTGQLLIYRPNENEVGAYIYFYCGGIVHAKFRDPNGNVSEGEQSLPQSLKIREGNFDFIFNKASPKTTIQGDPMGLLMEACRKADEA